MKKISCLVIILAFCFKGALFGGGPQPVTDGMLAAVPDLPMIHESFENTLQPHFTGLEADITEENIQARNRGALLMALSNKFGWLLLSTGNKSELAVGYCTLYGDMCGGLAVISDVPKTMVYKLADYINQRAGREVIPATTISKPPSAELRPDQTDQDSLPPYDILDEILEMYITGEKSIDEIIAAGFDAEDEGCLCVHVSRGGCLRDDRNLSKTGRCRIARTGIDYVM